MDCIKIGNLISKLRKEKNLTQKNLAEALGISNKTVSKWECGLGCPDLSYWSELSLILGVDMFQMMEGEITNNKPDNGNIDNILFYVCPCCGNILTSTGNASIFCCGRILSSLTCNTSSETLNITIEELDTDFYITFDHPMEKNHYMAFAAYVNQDSILLKRMYPEQHSSIRIPINHRGKLYLYCIKHGLTVYHNFV